uniref:Inhibitor_I29 domain-containing protein n=1 Tax=Strongyloides papillosus TaxID=174720 RepID=A0A0N5C3E4_STREA
MSFKLYLPIIVVLLVAFSLNCYAEYEDFFASYSQVVTTRKPTTSIDIEGLERVFPGFKDWWYEYMDVKREAPVFEDSLVDNLKKRSNIDKKLVPTHESNLRSDE